MAQIVVRRESSAILLGLVVVIVGFTIADTRFLASLDIQNILRATAILSITGYGMTLAIAMGAFDLSVGATQGLAAILSASLLEHSTGPVVAVLGGLVCGALVGLANGVVISKFRVPAFVTTLGTGSVVLGISFLYTNGNSILVTNGPFQFLGGHVFAGFLPMSFLLSLAVLALVGLTFHHSRFGRHIAAIGGGEQSARGAGIRIDRVIIGVFVLVGLTAAASGILLGSEIANVDPSIGTTLALQAIAVTVIGGTSLRGGRGNLVGTLLGALFLSSLNAGLNVIGVSTLYQDGVLGIVLIIALGADGLRRDYLDRYVAGLRYAALREREGAIGAAE